MRGEGKMTRLLRAVICHAGVLLCMLGYADLVYDSAAQVFSRDTPSEATRALPSKRLGKLIPYEGYEERLRQPARWQTMTPDEQAEAIGKIVLARKQFLERQQKLQAKYENKIKKSPFETKPVVELRDIESQRGNSIIVSHLDSRLQQMKGALK